MALILIRPKVYVDIDKRGPFLEFSNLCDLSNMDSIANCDKMESPRFLKTHLPLPVLPKELWTKLPKIIYVARDPRDATISDYHHFSKWGGSNITKEKFLDRMINDVFPTNMFRVEKIPDSSSDNLNHGVVNVTPVDSIKVGEVTMQPRICVLNQGIAKNIKRIANFHVRDDDVWVISYPKCGTTWVQEMCWLILNDFDFVGAKNIDIGKRGPFLEYSDLCNIPNMDSIDNCEKLESPRFLKSHLPLPVLPRELWTKHPKIVYVVRDPRDAAISYFHHLSKWFGLDNTKDEFLDWSLNSQIVYAPYWDHVIEFWNIRHQPNILFLTYEDMKANLKAIIQQTCDFFNKTITDVQMSKMLEHLSFESMKANDAAQHNFERSLIETENFDENFRFVRRGAIGSYKDEFPPHFIERYNEWMRNNLKRTDFDYYRKYL